eukprot:TRINITY_DN1711_c4_g2_i2.p1 TRINITY_DN1711_c4_g2~~TRINITY_DN1711_c4_g2_i2.p1  ORF type:complete len:607 (-),score=94.35 TRINITY_DN1711_c4_g2_i2:253-1992(-)
MAEYINLEAHIAQELGTLVSNLRAINSSKRDAVDGSSALAQIRRQLATRVEAAQSLLQLRASMSLGTTTCYESFIRTLSEAEAALASSAGSTASGASTSGLLRLTAAEHERMELLVAAFAVVASQRALPKPAWSLCRSMHHQVKPIVRLLLEGPWPSVIAAQVLAHKQVAHVELTSSWRGEADPLLALAQHHLSSQSGRCAADTIDRAFSQVQAVTFKHFSGYRLRIPRSVQCLHLHDCELDDSDSFTARQGLWPVLTGQAKASSSERHSELETQSGVRDMADVLALVSSIKGCRISHSVFKRIGAFTGLKVLHLSNCWPPNMPRLPESVGSLVALETLNLQGWLALTHLHDSIAGLQRLRTLDLSHCTALARLPDRFGELASLTHFVVRSCKQLTSLPDSFYSLARLRTLDCTQTGIATLSDSEHCLGGLAALTDLRWGTHELADAVSVPRSIGALRALTKLSIMCSRLVSLPDSIGELQALAVLNLNCATLCCLPDSVVKFQALTSLNLNYCHALTHLPDHMSELQALTSLDLHRCHALSSLPDSILELNALQRVQVGDCTLLVNVPEGIQKLYARY